MIKAVISVLSTFGFFSLFGLLGDEVKMTANFPSEIKAGNEFNVQVTINKGNIQGFARFQQELPPGFTVTVKDAAGGDFKFEDQKVSIKWIRLPYDKEFTVIYTMKIGPTVSGMFKMGGTFSYIQNNKVATADLTATEMNVKNDEEIARQPGDTAITVYKYGQLYIKNIDCIRQTPFLNDNNEIIVNILVKKGINDKFGKIQEQIPTGYYGVSVKSKNAIFSYKNHIIKFLWMNLPPEEQFTVTYKLLPEDQIPDKEFIITGTFSYVENERTEVINVVERNINLEEFDSERLVAESVTPEQIKAQQDAKPKFGLEKNRFASNVSSTQPGQTTQPGQIAQTTQPGQTGKQVPPKTSDLATKTDKNIISQTNQQQSLNQQLQPGTQTRQQTQTGNEGLQQPAQLTNIPMPADCISFRVQIAAGHRLVNARYFKKLNIKDEIFIEMHEGWHKYTIGTFEAYIDARDYRNFIWETTPISDAFVSAYNSGMRITVQEALMVTNQKWLK